MARPSTPILSREVIVQAVLDITDENGNFTMAQLAKALGVRPSSLYNHVASKSEIISMMRGVWLGTLLEQTADTEPGLEKLITLVEGFYLKVQEAPRLIPHFFIEPLIEPESLAYYEEIAKCAIAVGATEDQLSSIVLLADALVFGSALDAAAPEFDLGVKQRDAYPSLTRMVQHTRQAGTRGIDDFRSALDMIRRGLNATVEQ